MAMGLIKELCFLAATGNKLLGNRSSCVEPLRKCFDRGRDGEWDVTSSSLLSFYLKSSWNADIMAKAPAVILGHE